MRTDGNTFVVIQKSNFYIIIAVLTYSHISVKQLKAESLNLLCNSFDITKLQNLNNPIIHLMYCVTYSLANFFRHLDYHSFLVSYWP